MHRQGKLLQKEDKGKVNLEEAAGWQDPSNDRKTLIKRVSSWAFQQNQKQNKSRAQTLSKKHLIAVIYLEWVVKIR